MRMASCLMVSPAVQRCVLRLSCYASVILKKRFKDEGKDKVSLWFRKIIKSQSSSFPVRRSPEIQPS